MTTDTRTIDLDDAAALDALPIDAVLLCRVGEVFQVKRLDTFAGDGTGRAWFALGYGDRIWTPAEVAAWGPLLVLWPLPDADVSRETFADPDAALDPRLVQLGTLVRATAKPGAERPIDPFVATFIQWAGDGTADTEALLVLDVEGERVELLAREYSLAAVR